MKPAWDKLMDEYDGTSVVVGDVDCTVHQGLCGDYGVSGYPTIKVFDAANPEGTAYSSGREYDDIKSFIQENLEVKCQVSDPSECSEKEVKYINKMKGSGKVAAQLTRLTDMSGKKMKGSLKQWVGQRLSILRQLSDNKEEL